MGAQLQHLVSTSWHRLFTQRHSAATSKPKTIGSLSVPLEYLRALSSKLCEAPFVRRAYGKRMHLMRI